MYAAWVVISIATSVPLEISLKAESVFCFTAYVRAVWNVCVSYNLAWTHLSIVFWLDDRDWTQPVLAGTMHESWIWLASHLVLVRKSNMLWMLFPRLQHVFLVWLVCVVVAVLPAKAWMLLFFCVYVAALRRADNPTGVLPTVYD
jgi:hypothetical protein